jgi:La-related protein 7
MSESETTEGSKIGHNPRKRIRPRKKKLYEDILTQMEFYFSDANLTKDRFLGDLVKNNPYVPIDTFLKFNKIRSMTTDVTIISKSIKKSDQLELSDDRLKVIFFMFLYAYHSRFIPERVAEASQIFL